MTNKLSKRAAKTLNSKKALRALLREGLSTTDIAIKIGAGQATVSNRIRDMKLKPAFKKGSNPRGFDLDDGAVKLLYRAGVATTEGGELLSCTSTTFLRAMQRQKLEPKYSAGMKVTMLDGPTLRRRNRTIRANLAKVAEMASIPRRTLAKRWKRIEARLRCRLAKVDDKAVGRLERIDSHAETEAAAKLKGMSHSF